MAGHQAEMAASPTVVPVIASTGIVAKALLNNQEAGAMQVGDC